MNLTKEKGYEVSCPVIKESPVNIECKVQQMIDLGSHTMFVAEVASVNIDDKYMKDTGRFALNEADLIVYSHGQYYTLGENVGKFGFSVKK